MTYESNTLSTTDTTDPLGMFGRYLTLWVALCIISGVGLGYLMPNLFIALSHLEIAQVNLIVALLIWVMIYPMMVNVDFNCIKQIGDKPKGIIITLVINWLVKPFSMALLAVLFFEHLYTAWITPTMAKEYIAGLILLAAAPCTAMVFVWSTLTRGDATYTLIQVSLNDLIMIFAFAPIVALLLGVTNISVPYSTLLLSVVLYVVIPVVAGYLTRQHLSANLDKVHAEQKVHQFTEKLKPYTIIGLLLTIVLLFGFQGNVILQQPQIIVLIAIPLIIQCLGIFIITYWWAHAWRVPFNIAAPAALIGTSNFFELAVAVAISLFGLNSGAALATVVGVLVEVPAMLLAVNIANHTRDWFSWDKEVA